MHHARYDLIAGPSPKRPKRNVSDVVNLEDVENDDVEAEPDVDMTKKESRSRSFLAIESIANNSVTQTSLQVTFFQDQAEKHDIQKKSSELKNLLKNKTLKKAALEMLILKQQHNLLTEQ